MRSELISIASVEGGKYHRLADKHVDREDGWKPRLMLCGRTLKPLNYFVNEQDANKHTGGRFKEHACAHCEGIADVAEARKAITDANGESCNHDQHDNTNHPGYSHGRGR